MYVAVKQTESKWAKIERHQGSSRVDQVLITRIHTYEEHGPSWVAHPRHAAAFAATPVGANRHGIHPDPVVRPGSDGAETTVGLEAPRRP